MAKNNRDKKPTPKVEAAPTSNGKDKTTVEVLQTGDFMKKLTEGGTVTAGLSPDGTVMALNGLKSMIHDNPRAAEYYGLSDDQVKNFNKLTVAGFATVLAIEIVDGKSKFAQKMLANQIEAVNAISEYTGITIDKKLLPAPDETGAIEVPSDNIKVSKEAEKKIKEEKKIVEKAIADPTKIENDEQLKASLVALLSDMKEARPYERIMKAIMFYNSYLTFQASKAENKDEAIAEVKKLSTVDLFSKITEIAGPHVYSLEGICKMLRATINKTGSIIPAFCLFRNASANPKTKVTPDDAIVADMLKVLISWSSKAGIEETNKRIATANRTIEKNQDKVGVVNAQKALIEKLNSDLEYYNSFVAAVNDPTFEIADNYENVIDNKDHELYKKVKAAHDNILSTYYKDVDLNTVDVKTLNNNVKQYCGIITNLFRDPLTRSIAYSKSELLPITQVEEPEEKK